VRLKIALQSFGTAPRAEFGFPRIIL
jgi:hypothetical protein